MDIIIEQLENTDYSIEDVFKLIQSSFEERIRQGLSFTCSTMPIDKFIRRTKDSVLLVAILKKDEVCRQLVGTATFHIYTDKNSTKYGYLEYLAAHPLHKRNGICTSLFKVGSEILKNANCAYICSDTATKACSSVNWHKKQGFKIIGLESYLSTDYYSFLFKMHFYPKKWDKLSDSISCCLSFLRILIIKNRYGDYTHIGRILRKIRVYLCES